MQEAVEQITADDTAASTATDGASDKGTIAGGKTSDVKPAADAKPNGKAADAAAEGEKPKPNGKGGTIAAGRDSEADEADAEPDKPYWPEDWREKMAKHRAGDDDKAYKKELKRLQNFASPEGVYGMGREAEAKLTSGKLLKRPEKDAKPEEVKEFYQQLGAPEKPDDYYSNIQLDNGAVVGEADKPFLDDLAKTVHNSSAPVSTEQFKVFTNWYYKQQEINAAKLDDDDDDHRIQSERSLKEEFGPSFKRTQNAIPVLFMQAPGGSDINNEKGVYARLMGGRTADGKIIGNDPDVFRWLNSLRAEINPNATVTEDGAGTPQTVEDEIKKIEGIMRTDRKTYNRDHAARYAELLKIREKNQARAR
jgi:hypothetical protein